MAQDTATLDIGTATSSDLTGTVTDVTVQSEITDGATGSNETTWINDRWSTQYGYYMDVPEVKIAIDTRAIWTAGKKYTTTDVGTDIALERISGWGEDTFQNILQNMITLKRIGGDAFAEIMRDPDTKRIINIKVLDPGTIRVVVDKKGILKRYEQVGKNNKVNHTFTPNEMFHLLNKRVADNIHGTGDIDPVEDIILALKESFVDVKKLFHRNVKPIHMFHVDTDDATKMNAFIATTDKITEKGENLYVPKDLIDHELITVPSSATLSPFAWRDELKNYFYQTVGIPQIILGNAAEFSESSSKIAYISFQQSVEAEQLDIESAVWKQLGLHITLSFPATIQNEMISDDSKDGANAGMGIQPNETTINNQQQDGGL